MLTPPPVDRNRAEKLIKVVCGDGEDAADRAAAELVKLGSGIRPLIEVALKGDLDADARIRLLAARSKVPGPDPVEEARRAPRVVALLKQMGTKKAEALLADMVAGKFGDVWTRAAKATER
jgi:hypothetical protein